MAQNLKMELETYKESLIMECNINRETSSPRCRRSMSNGGSITPTPMSRPCSMPPESPMTPPLNHTIEVYTDPVVEDEGTGSGGSGGSSWAGWETHHVSVSRVPGYGFGIAVSGGRDNPHFASGDPSIAVSDVLKAGPAQDLLQVNDRIMSVNGHSLENVEYATAVQVLRDSGNTVSLVVRRRAAPPTPTPSSTPTTIKLTLTKGKKEDFGIVLGCKLFIKELSPKAREQLSSSGQCLNEGDIITRINNTSCNDSMSLKEAKKLIESCKERLNIVAVRESRTSLNNSTNLHEQSYQNNLGSDALNSYSGQNLYVAPPSRSTLLGDNTLNSSVANNLNGVTNGNTPTNGGRTRGPLPVSHDPPSSPHQHNHPPRPPPPRAEGDYYSSRRQLYEDDPINQRNKPTVEPRLISFQKDGSVGLRLTGGNQAGIFVSAVQPGSPASLQGLSLGDKILKVNDMDMKGVTREEAVLFLLSLQEQIDLIVQYSPDEYQSVTSQQRGDSFHIKCHFHYMEATKGEMTFRSGDVFHVVDTLHNGTVGAWQVYRIGRNNQEVQQGTIPNKARAEELATAQFNANKKELTQGASESRGSFFRRRRSTHRRSKSLGKEHWDDVVFSDSISKFPAYERVLLKHPGFVRPVILFGPISDLAREKLLRDFPEKFTSPQLETTEDGKSKSTSGIIRLSGIRSIMDRGKHALLDITPNAVDRLNYAQFYPIVIFLKADNKHIIKQLRQGMPKSAHKSSKKLLEYCQRMERVWGHIFSQTIGLNEATATTWYSKLTDLIQRSQSQQLWISETKRSEPLSDDFLFPMCSTNESRLSYASSPESDVEAGGAEAGPRLLRASSDPSVATAQDNLDRDNLTLNDMVPPPPPYTSGYGDSKYGFSSNGGGPGPGQGISNHSQSSVNIPGESEANPYNRTSLPHSPLQSPPGIYGHVPDLPPRIDRGVKPPGGVLLPGPTPGRNPPTLRHHSQANNRPSAQERLFGTPRNSNTEVDGAINNGGMPIERSNNNSNTNTQGSLDRHRHNTNSYDSMSSYDSYGPNGLAATTALALSNSRLGPNAPDDLKVNPRNENNKYDVTPVTTPQKRLSAGGGMDVVGSGSNLYSSREINGGPNNTPGIYGSREGVGHGMYSGNNQSRTMPPQPRMQMPPSDYNKYSNRNSTGPVEYVGSIGKAAGAGGPALYKPVPPPKPKHYRPPVNDNQHMPQPHHTKSYSVGNGGMEMVNGNRNHHPSNPNLNVMGSPTSAGPPNGYNYSSPNRGGAWPSGVAHAHSHSHPGSGNAPPYHPAPHSHQQNMYGGNAPQAPPYNGPPPHMRGPPQTTSPQVIDLAGSREQRGSAFELYRKPQHIHNLSSTEAMSESVDNEANATPKTRKKLSKKSSFLKSITLDLFRSKTSKKISKHHSLREKDLQKGNVPSDSENFDFICADQSLSNSTGKSRGLFRSNSSCDKKPLKPILKRQTSFCETNYGGGNGLDITQRRIAISNEIRRRQNSMCEMDTGSKIEPLLRRQNSLIEYGRRGIYDNPYKNFNMITTIDPIYQRMQKHEPFYPQTGDIQLKSEYVSNAVAKPERTYATRGSIRSTSSEPTYTNRKDIIMRQTQCPYASRQEVINHQNTIIENTHHHRENIHKENPYSTKEDLGCHHESPYGTTNRNKIDTLYGTREDIIKYRSAMSSPYSTREDNSRYNLMNESPYSSRDEAMKMQKNIESPYTTKTEMLKQRMNIESPYATRDETLRQMMNIESPYATREEAIKYRINSENPYGTRDESFKKRLDIENPYSTRECMKLHSNTENPYATRDEVSRQNLYATKREAIYPGIHSNISQHNNCRVLNVEEVVCDINLNSSTNKEKMIENEDVQSLNKSENSYVTKYEMKHNIQTKSFDSNANPVSACPESQCTCESISSSAIREPCSNFIKNESPYVTKQEILSQKAAFLASKEKTASQSDDKLEIIKQRNLAKKDKIYQSRLEALGNDSKTNESIYVSKRTLKDSIIYESQQEMKDVNKNNCAGNRDSPFELSDIAHLSRRESLYQTKQEILASNKRNQIDINFDTLRLHQPRTVPEKIQPIEKTILKGEPIYQSRLPVKNNHPMETNQSVISMDTLYSSECSMQFENKPQSTPFTSQDIGTEVNIPIFKCNNKSGRFDDSDADVQNTTVVSAAPLYLDTDILAVGQKGKLGGPDGPTTTWGIFDNEGGVLEDRAWGVSLVIPPDAILPGVKQKIYFTVTDPRLSQNVGGPPIDMDKGEALLSPVVMCGPQGLGFARPVTLRLPHCANTLPSLGLTLNATDTEPAPSWDNILLPATTTLNTVAVKVDHF